MNNITRCPWSDHDDPLIKEYHDHEWGKLNLDEHYLYEMLLLDSFQSGLSWSTILSASDIEQLMQDKGIIRNKRKITAAINNARALLIIDAQYGSFAHYLQQFIKTPIMHHPQTSSEVPTTNKVAQKLAGQMKKDGFTFVGPVIIYSFLEGVGLINDHLENCPFKYHG